MGAEITGIELSEHTDQATLDRIWQVWLENQIVCVRNQPLKPAQLPRLVERFGTLNTYMNMAGRDPDLAITMILNKPTTVNGREFAGVVADGWHTDQALTANPPSASFSSAQVLPKVGGDTLFANMYMAYETLSPAYQRMIDPLEGVFNIVNDPNFDMFSPEKQADIQARNPPVVHSLVKIHPETGRKSLYAPHQIHYILGMSVEESKPLRDFLSMHSTRYEFQYRHHWLEHDLLIWDNRCLMHRAAGDFDRNEFRHMVRAEILAPPSGRLLEEPPPVKASA